MGFTKRVTAEGYSHLTKDELFNEIVATAGEQGITIVEHSDDWAIAKYLTEIFDNLYGEINQLRANTNPLEATGSALDELCLLKSIERRESSQATVRITVHINGTYIFPVGSIQVGDGNGHSFKNSEEMVVSGSSTGLFSSIATGIEQNVNANKITEIETDPSGQMTSVSNTSNASGGRSAESDDTLRLRLINTYPSVLSVVRLEQELSKIEGITYARVFNNYLHNPSINGVPFEKTAIVLEDGRSENNFTSDVSRKVWETIRANSVTNENWYTSDTLIKEVRISGTHNGARLEYPVIKPSNIAVKYKVEITNSNTRLDKLEEVIFDHISSIVEAKQAGDLLTGAEVLARLFSAVKDCKEASAITVQVARRNTAAWVNNYSLQLQFHEKPTLANGDVEVVYGGNTL